MMQAWKVWPLWVLTILVLALLLGPLFSPHDPLSNNLASKFLSPGVMGQHWFGTDSLGRDVFVRIVHGGQLSLLVALVSTLVSLIVGVSWGAIAGYAGGRVDAVMMRTVDILYALPFMFLVILLMVLFGRNLLLMFVAIGLINWLDMARIVRGQTLALRQQEFVLAARLYGASHLRLIFRHIVPNLMNVTLVYLALTVPQAILIESFLSFLGLGVQDPYPSLGGLINEGVKDMDQAPWQLIIPSALLALLLILMNSLADRWQRLLKS